MIQQKRISYVRMIHFIIFNTFVLRSIKVVKGFVDIVRIRAISN